MKQTGPSQTDLSGESLTASLSALADETSLRALRVLEREELSVGEVAKVLQIPQSTASRKLKTLDDAGWIEKRAEGVSTLFRMVLDDLSAPARGVWLGVREQMGESAAVVNDRRRLDAVLAERGVDSRTFFGRVAGQWDEIRATLFGADLFGSALPALCAQNANVVDLGCGTGAASAKLAPFARRVIAIDHGEQMVAAARARLGALENVEVALAELTDTPVKSASADLAIMALVLHHLDEPEGALHEAARLLKAGGRLLIIDMQPHAHREYKRTMGHKHLGFDPDALTGMLARAGLGEVRISALPADPEAKGPPLFVAVATKTN